MLRLISRPRPPVPRHYSIASDFSRLRGERPPRVWSQTAAMGYPTAMFRTLATVAHALRALFRSRFEIAIENAALRQQLAVMKQSRGRPRLRGSDRLFWVFLHRVWSGWVEAHMKS